MGQSIDHFRYFQPRFLAVLVPTLHLNAKLFPWIFGYRDFFAHHHKRHVAYIVFTSTKINAQIRVYLAFFGLTQHQFTTIFSRRRNNQLLGHDFLPSLVTAHTMSAVDFLTVKITHPPIRQTLQLLNAANSHHSQTAFKLRFHQIVAVFHLPFGSRIAHFVDNHIHAKLFIQVLKSMPCIRRPWVKHHIHRHTAKWVLQTLRFRLHCLNKRLAQILRVLATKHIPHKQAA